LNAVTTTVYNRFWRIRIYRYEWVAGWYRVLHGKDVSMANDLEKRISNRHSVEGPITLYSSIGASKEFDAHLLNFSEQGICFTTKTKMVPGTNILFKASKDCHLFAEDYADCQLLSFRMVTVKWRHESSQKNQPIYIIGAKYMIPF